MTSQTSPSDTDIAPTSTLPPPVIPARVERSLWWYVAAVVAVLMFVATVTIVVASIPDPMALLVSVIAAAAPTVVYVWLIVRLDPFEAEPRHMLIGAFGWGAVGAVVLSVVLTVVFVLTVANTPDPNLNFLISLAIGAPLIEESAKGLALLAILFFYRHELDNVLDGLVYGAMIGIGFAMTENILYFGATFLDGGVNGLGELFIARAVISGFGHPIYTAITGAAIGWSREQYSRGLWRFVLPTMGWGVAVVLHSVWNSGVIFTSAALGPEAGVIQIVFIDALLFILPAVAILFLIARVAHRRELRVLRAELVNEVRRGAITPDEYEILFHDALRARALRLAQARGGRQLRHVQQRFFEIAAELAFREYHLSQGEEPKPGHQQPEDVYRVELGRLRATLAAAGLPEAVVRAG